MITYIWKRTGARPGTMYAVPENRAPTVMRRLRRRAEDEPGLTFTAYTSLGDADAMVRYAARAHGGNGWVVPLRICANDPLHYDVQSILIASRWLWA